MALTFTPLLTHGHVTFLWWLYHYLVLCFRLSAKVSQLAMSVTLSSVNINITLSYPAANTSRTKGTLTCYLPSPEVHSFKFGLHLWSWWSGSPAFHTHLSMQTTLAIPLVLPSLSSHTWLTLTSSSPYPRMPSPQYLQTFLSPSLSSYINSNGKVMEA